MTAFLRNQAFESKIRTHRDEILREYLETLIGQSVRYWQQYGAVGGENRGYGIVVKIIRKDGSAPSLDLHNPADMYDFVFGNGDEARRFFYRAVCKQRATVRTLRSTAELLAKKDFQNVVTDEEMDSSEAQFGEYPHAGAVLVQSDGYDVHVAMSGLSGKEDHEVALFWARMTLLKLEELDKAETSVPVAAMDTVSEE